MTTFHLFRDIHCVEGMVDDPTVHSFIRSIQPSMVLYGHREEDWNRPI
jgi:hypothetical protein